MDVDPSRRSVLVACAAGLGAVVLPGTTRAGAVPVVGWGPALEPIASAHEISGPLLEGALEDRSTALGGVSTQLGGLEAGSTTLTGTDTSTPAAIWTTLGPFTFRRIPFTIQRLPEEYWAYRLSRPPATLGWGVVDRYGVRMDERGGRLYDHPVGQAQHGINLLESYRVFGDARFLDLAKRQAARLVSRAVSHGGGWFYPYPFRIAVHRYYDVYEPPWYSQMAQGQALSLFCRLYRLTGLPVYRQAAYNTFATFLVRPQVSRPWGVYVVNGQLWFEEYPHASLRGDRTYNGHTFAAWGLWDFWMLFGDARALVLLQGGLTTTLEAHTAVRRRQWRGKYCLRHGVDAGKYHFTHIFQHAIAHAVTGDAAFSRVADLFHYDFPLPAAPGTVRFAPGARTAYRFGSTGAILATKTVSFARRSHAAAAQRDKVLNRAGIWYLMANGTFAGYRVPEIPSNIYQLGEYAALGYRLARPARVARTPLWSYTIDAAGAMRRYLTPYRVGDVVSVNRRAQLNGVQHLRLASGSHAGQWVVTPALTLTG